MTAITYAIFTVIGLLLKVSVNIRNAIGIKKDLLETEKVEQELEQKRQRIQLATPDEIIRHDPRIRRVIEAARATTTLGERPPSTLITHQKWTIKGPSRWIILVGLKPWWWNIVVGLIVGLLVGAIVYFVQK